MMRMIAILSLVAMLGAAMLVWQDKAKAKVDITETGPNGLPIIFWRIEQDDRSAVRALIATGIDIEIKGFQQATPAISAAAANSWITTKLLIELGADVRAADLRGFTLPWMADNSQMNPDAREGRALAEVKALLAAQGLMTRIYQPREVEAMVASGDWPPPGW